MATQVLITKGKKPDSYVSIAFCGHSASIDGDRELGMRLCAAMSTLASVVEAHIETLGLAHNLIVVPAPPDGVPSRTVSWNESDANKMFDLVTTIKQILLLLSAQYPDNIGVSEV